MLATQLDTMPDRLSRIIQQAIRQEKQARDSSYPAPFDAGTLDPTDQWGGLV